MHSIDWAIIVGYFLLLFGFAWWLIRRSKNTADDYFLAGRGLGWFIVGASIFAANIGSEHLVSLAGSGCTDGVAMAHYELHAWCPLVLNSFWLGSVLAIVFTGFYTILGGLRAVAYTEALQTVILVLGSLLVTIFGLQALGGWDELRAICGSEMFNLWTPLVPAGVEGTRAPVLDTNAAGEVTRQAWYFNGNYP